MRKIFFIMITVATMSSCGIYKSYQRPDVKTDGLYRDAINETDTMSLGNVAWRELFTDPQLQDLIVKGLENNSDLRVARLRVTQAESSLKSARLAYVPSLNFTPQGTAVNGFNAGKMATYQLALSANWELDIFGKLTNAKRGAEAAVEQSSAYKQAVQTQVIATVANTYYTLLMLDSQLDISEKTLINWRENVKVMRALKAAGQADEAAVAQSEANALSVEASILKLKQQINEMENSLSTLLGKTPQTVSRGKLEEQSFPSTLAIGIPLQMLSNRPDVRQAEFSLAQAYYGTNQARAAFYPSITLSGTAGWTNNVGSYIANPGKIILSGVGALTQPIFNKGLNKARLEIAKAQQEEALINFQQMLLNAGADVNDALVQWQVARERIDVDAKQIEFLKSAVKSTQLLMQYSNRNYIEVLIAQQSLLQAQITQVSDQFGEIQGVINLYHALGGGR